MRPDKLTILADVAIKMKRIFPKRGIFHGKEKSLQHVLQIDEKDLEVEKNFEAEDLQDKHTGHCFTENAMGSLH